jgi:hypothetical protein
MPMTAKETTSIAIATMISFLKELINIFQPLKKEVLILPQYNM